MTLQKIEEIYWGYTLNGKDECSKEIYRLHLQDKFEMLNEIWHSESTKPSAILKMMTEINKELKKL